MRQNYATFDFANFDEKGLSGVKEAFERAGVTVIDLEASNRSRRMSGFATKSATFYFEDGQTITLRIKGDGDVFQVKLNSRVVPIRNVHSMKEAVGEMARYLQANAPAWKKAQRRKQQRAKVDEKDMKAKPLPRAKKIEALEADVAELDSSLSDLASEKDDLTKQLDERQQTIQTLEQQIQDAA